MKSSEPNERGWAIRSYHSEWGPGRTDVSMRGGGNELVHKSYANGRWSGWEDLGGCSVMYQKTYNCGWSDFKPVDLLWGVSTFRVGAVYWTP